MFPLRILVADDHPVYRDGLRLVLSSMPGAEMVGEASTGAEAIALAADLQPDVVMMDLRMPEPNGIEATRQIVFANPRVAVLVVTMFDDDESVFAAMRAGARGYVLKGADRAEIMHAVQAVASEELVFGPGIADRVLGYFSALRGAVSLVPFPELTEREREVLAHIARGSNNQDIARRLVLSPKTIRNHVSNIFTKLQVADRSQAIVRAREAGLGGDDMPSPAPWQPDGQRGGSHDSGSGTKRHSLPAATDRTSFSR
jgi:DNA-binding NarL/FixJ family response regulator